MCFPEMSHLITSAHKRVCSNLIRYGFLEVFFQRALPDLQIQMIVVFVLDGFQVCNILFSLFEIGMPYNSGWLIIQLKSRIGRTNLLKGCKSLPN